MNLQDIFNLIYSKYVCFGTYEELLSVSNDVNGHYQTVHPTPLNPTHPHSAQSTPTHPKYFPTNPHSSKITHTHSK